MGEREVEGDPRGGYWRECNAPYSLSYDTGEVKASRLKLNRAGSSTRAEFSEAEQEQPPETRARASSK